MAGPSDARPPNPAWQTIQRVMALFFMAVLFGVAVGVVAL